MRVLQRIVAPALAAAALLSAAGAGGAQTIPSPYRHIEPAQSLSLFGGYFATDRGEVDAWPAPGPMFGAQYTGRFAAPVAGIARLWAAASERTVFTRQNAADPESELIPIEDTSAMIVAGEVGLRLLLTGPRTWNSIAPYIEGTGALMAVAGSRTEEERQLPTNQVIDYGPSFAVGLGAGADWFLSDRVSVNFSARGLLWRLTMPEGLTTTGREDNEWTRNYGVSIGAAYHF